MIARHLPIKKTGNSSYARLVDYLLDPQGRRERVGHIHVTNCRSDEIEDVIAEVTNTQLINKRAVSAKTYHLLVSFRPEDVLTKEMMVEIESQLCDALGYGEHQRVSVVHYDTDNTHIHVAINKIHPARYTMHTPKGDYRALLKVSGTLEQQYGLMIDNHQVKKRGEQSKAMDMESRAGLQSLLTWLQQNCLNQLKAAKNWQEVHDLLQSHGIELKTRGNGLVFVSKDEVAVKASSVDRALSKNNLVKRLGVFVPAINSQNPSNNRKNYRKKTIGAFNQDKLFNQYSIEQNKILTLREDLLSYAREQKEKHIHNIRTSANLKRAFIKNMPPGLGRKVLYWTTFQSQKQQIKRVKKGYLDSRKEIYRNYPCTPWRQWVDAQAQAQHKNRQISR